MTRHLRKGESSLKMLNHPSEGWIAKKSELKKGDWRVNHPPWEWSKHSRRVNVLKFFKGEFVRSKAHTPFEKGKYGRFETHFLPF